MTLPSEQSDIIEVQMPSDDWQKYLRDKKIEHHQDIYGFATSYDNLVIIAGYAAFFALWSGIANDITVASRAVIVISMGISLTSYIIWQLMQMLARQKFEFERADAFDHQLEPEKFNDIWDDALLRYTKRQNREIKTFWPITFITSVVLGLGSGIFLVSQAIAIAMGWPQFTGYL